MSLTIPILNDVIFTELKELKDNIKSVSNLQRDNTQRTLNLINSNYNKNSESIQKQNSKIDIIHNLFSNVYNIKSNDKMINKEMINYEKKKTNIVNSKQVKNFDLLSKNNTFTIKELIKELIKEELENFKNKNELDNAKNRNELDLIKTKLSEFNIKINDVIQKNNTLFKKITDIYTDLFNLKNKFKHNSYNSGRERVRTKFNYENHTPNYNRKSNDQYEWKTVKGRNNK
jgi:hypothetical protein